MSEWNKKVTGLEYYPLPEPDDIIPDFDEDELDKYLRDNDYCPDGKDEL